MIYYDSCFEPSKDDDNLKFPMAESTNKTFLYWQLNLFNWNWKFTKDIDVNDDGKAFASNFVVTFYK